MYNQLFDYTKESMKKLKKLILLLPLLLTSCNFKTGLVNRMYNKVSNISTFSVFIQSISDTSTVVSLYERDNSYYHESATSNNKEFDYNYLRDLSTNQTYSFDESINKYVKNDEGKNKTYLYEVFSLYSLDKIISSQTFSLSSENTYKSDTNLKISNSEVTDLTITNFDEKISTICYKLVGTTTIAYNIEISYDKELSFDIEE